MKPYLITGPDSLLKAAQLEAVAAFGPHIKIAAKSPNGIWILNHKCCGVAGEHYNPNYYQDTLALPADWDKLMGILADLKKPKLPEYVKAEPGKVYKLIGPAEKPNTAYGYNVYGEQKTLHLTLHPFNPIREQEFIEGGLKELAEAGYVKGAKVVAKGGDSIFTVDDIRYRTPASLPCPISIAVGLEKNNKGFCFSIETNGGGAIPIGICTLIPALPTTSEGIPYKTVLETAYVGVTDPEYLCAGSVSLQKSTLKHLLRQGVTELVTKAGRLTQADLELLTR